MDPRPVARREEKIAAAVREEAERQQRFLDEAASRGLRPPGARHAAKTLRRLSAFFADCLFREETARRNGLAQRINPRARLVSVLVFLCSVSLARSLSSLAVHAALPAAAAALARIRPREFLGAGFWAALLFSLAMAAPATLNVFREGEIVLPLFHLAAAVSVGPWTIPPSIGVTREGLFSAATFLLRVLPSTAAVLWLTLSTRWTDLLRALRVLRLPPLFVQVAGMTVRYVHAFLRQVEEIHQGKKARTLCRAPGSRERGWAGSRIAASWERSLHLMEEVHAAMVARGFTGEARFPPDAHLRAADRIFLAAVVLFCGGAHLA